MIVDTKVMPSRKYYLVFFGVLFVAVNLLIFLRVKDEEYFTVFLLALTNLCHFFLDCTVDSFIVE